MGRKSISELAHPGKVCEACSKCKKLKKDDPRNFHHVIAWTADQKCAIKDHFNLEDDSCLCDACRQVVKRGLSGPVLPKTRKKERGPCFLHAYGKCTEASYVECNTGGWSDFASKLGLQDCPPAALASQVPLCKMHYYRLSNLSRVRCAQCTKVIVDRPKKSENYKLLNKFNEDMGTKIILTPESCLCIKCYNHGRRLGDQENLVSVIEDLKDVIQEQDNLSARYFDGDMQVYAASKMVSYTGKYIMEKGPLLLCEAGKVYHNFIREAYDRKGYSVPDSAKKSNQSLMIELVKGLGHHLIYSTVPSKPLLGTLLMRRGIHITHVLHEQIVRANIPTKDSKPMASTSCHEKSETEEKQKVLNKAAQIINSELRRQSKIFAAKASTQLFTDFDLNESIQEIDSTLWNFFYLLTETTTDQRLRDSEDDFSFTSSKRSAQDARRLFSICHAMFIMNDQANYPLHLMLADTVQCQGGSQMLIQMLNRFGVTSSRTSLDAHKNAVVIAHARKMEEQITSSPSFRVASIDNIDKGSPHAVVHADAISRSVHGTSYQLVFPQPTAIVNTGDDYTPCSTAALPLDPDSLQYSKVVRDRKNLYRCLARRNSPQLRSSLVNDNGVLMNTAHADEEESMLKAFKDDIIHVLEENEETFMDELGTLLPSECLDIMSRIELVKKESCIPSAIECAAVAILAKCPVHIYRLNDCGSRYLYQQFGACFTGTEPLSLQEDALGFDLLLSSYLHTSSYDLIVFKENIFRAWRELNSRLLGDKCNASAYKVICQENQDEEIPLPPGEKKRKLQDFHRERQFVHHSYEASSIRAPPPSLTIDEFAIQPQELDAVKNAKDKVHRFMTMKACDSPTSSLKEVLSNSPPEKSKAFYLGVINQHADDIETVKGTLQHLHKSLEVGKRIEHLIVVGDAKTYGHLVKIKQEYVEDMKWLIPFPGDWHILKNLQPVLMKIYWHAGLHGLAMKNHKGATLTSLASCGHFKRTHRFLLSAWEAMYQSQLQAFMRKYNVEEVDPDLFADFTRKQAEEDATYRMWHNFIHRDALSYVLLYYAIRTGNWHLRVAALKMMGPLFHAFDRPMYLRLIPGHLSDILQMPPSILDHLEKGGFVVSLKGREGQCLALDEAHETLINRDVKMSLHKPDPQLMDKLALYLPYRAMGQERLRNQVLPSGDTYRSGRNDKHMEETVKVYVDVLSSSPLALENPRTAVLTTLLSDVPADDVQQHDLSTFYDTGKKDMDSYITSRILQVPSTKAPRRRNALRTFLPKKKKKVMVNQKEKQKRIVTACLRRHIAYAKKTGKPIDVLGQFIKLPLAISKSDGTMYKGSKAVTTNVYQRRYSDVFLECLPKGWKPDCVILEGMFLINTTPLTCHKLFGDYLRSLVTSYIMYHVRRGVKEVHVVFDDPHRNGISPKDLERERRDEHRIEASEESFPIITADTTLPNNWRKFLGDRKQKRLLVNFLSEAIPKEVQRYLGPSQILVTAGGMDHNMRDKALLANAHTIVECPIFGSNHEESDSRVWFHAQQTTCCNIQIYSPDTDTYHVGLPLMVSHLHQKHIVVQLSLQVRDHSYCDMNEFIVKVNSDPDLDSIPIGAQALILQLVYIISGCDYTSFFVGCGKTSFYTALYQFTKFVTGGELRGSLADVTTNEDEALLAFYRLVGAVYFKKNFASFKPMKTPFEVYKSVASDQYIDDISHHEKFLGLIREATWSRADSEEGILPSLDALYRHWLRCLWVYKLWAQASVSLVIHPTLEGHGYKREGDNISICWDSAENEATVQNQVDWILKGCKCRTGCSTQRCRCMKENRACGPGCECLHCCNPLNGATSQDADIVGQVQEETLMEALNNDNNVEEEVSDEEADCISWVEDACSEVSDEDDDDD